MDSIKTAYGYAKAGYVYVVNLVAEHPVATVNSIIVAALARIALAVVL